MKFVKSICCLLVSVLFLCSFSQTCMALPFLPGITPPQGEITEIPNTYLSSYGSFASQPATLFPVGCPADDILHILPHTIDGIIGASGEYVPCNVAWTPPDTSAPGWILVTGMLSPPPGCTILSGLETVTFPIMLYADGMSSVESFSQLFLYNQRMETYLAELIAVGDELSSLKFPAYSAIGVCQNGQYYQFPVKWDLSSVDTLKVGEYPVVGFPVLPSCFALPSGFTGFSATVFVGSPSGISLLAVTQKSLTSVACEWQQTISDPQNIHLKYSTVSANGPFEEDPVLSSGAISNGQQINTYYSYYTGNKLSISLDKLENEKEYFFTMQYNGVESDVLSVTAQASGLPKTHGIGGDRDGGDRGEQAALPTPTIAPSASAAPSAPTAPSASATTSSSTAPSAAPSALVSPSPQPSATEPLQKPRETKNAILTATNSAPPISSPSSTPTPIASVQISDNIDTENTMPVFPVWLVLLFAAAAICLVIWLVWRWKRHES
ncbi:MAG: hypothetical protein RR504_06960 [Christensenellaceae bacterium]